MDPAKKRKLVTLGIALFAAALDGLAVWQGGLSPDWAALIGVVISIGYGVVRTAQKVAAGAELSSLFRSTDTWIAVLAFVGPVLAAIQGVLPVQYAASFASAAAVVAVVVRRVQSALLPKQDVAKVETPGDPDVWPPPNKPAA